MTATPAGMTYADYLALDQLLGAQQPLSDLHDEMLFIVIHQTKELWLKQMLHELGLAIGLVGEDRFAEAYKAMARISRIQSVMTLSWDVLSTLTPVDYMNFRHVLGTRRGSSRRNSASSNIGSGSRTRLPRTLSRRHGGARARCRRRSTSQACARRRHAALERAGLRRRRPLGGGARARPGSRSIATPTAGSTSTSWPRNWSTSTMRWRCGGTSMC